ncbi:DNA-processing protein DprA [Alkalibacillus flavidus]
MKRQLLSRYLLEHSHLDPLLDASSTELSLIFSLPTEQASKLNHLLHDERYKQQMWQRFCNLSVITWFDSSYPDSLRLIPDPPLILYYQGNLKLLATPMISVIGSRTPSQDAEQKISYILKELVKHQFTIVSGMAKGVDGLSHEFALKQKIGTIAVLGFGFNYIYPARHRELFQRISKNGLILSEYPPETRAQKWHFPERNRIISGLSRATLIVEAAEKSGTMITADQALEQAKDVFVIPDSIFLPQAKGCHRLLQEGAIPVTAPEQLIEYLSSGAWIHST